MSEQIPEQEENGGKWEGKGRNTHICHSPILPIFPDVKNLPHSSLRKSQTTALTEKNGKGSRFRRLTATVAEADGCFSLEIRTNSQIGHFLHCPFRSVMFAQNGIVQYAPLQSNHSPKLAIAFEVCRATLREQCM